MAGSTLLIYMQGREISLSSHSRKENQMDRDDKIYDLKGFCNMQDDCSQCRLDALTDNCDFDELPDKKIDQLYKIVERIIHKGTEENSITEELTGVVKDVNKGAKTVTSVLEEIKREMCDEYCVYAKLTPNFQKEIEETCNRCPVNYSVIEWPSIFH